MVSQDCYVEQVRRLRDTYGDRNYPKERMSLFYRELGRYSDDVFIRAINQVIYEERQAPMPPKIIETILDIEERDREVSLREQTGLLDKAVETSNNPEFARLCMSVIRDRMSGKMTEAQYEQAMQYIDAYCDQIELAEHRFFCKPCRNSGYQFNVDEKGYRWVSNCDCSFGSKVPKLEV